MYNYGDEVYHDLWLPVVLHLDATTACRLAQSSRLLCTLCGDKEVWELLLRRDRKQAILLPPCNFSDPKVRYRLRQDFETIGDAIEAAKKIENADAGLPTVFVAPGRYKENVVVDHPLNLIGEGQLGDVVIESVSAQTVLVSATEGLISNFKLMQSALSFCVEVTSGNIEIRGCDISNSTLSAVKVGRGAAPSMRYNHIHDSHEAGIAVFGGAALIEYNEFTRNRYGSIEVVHETAAPTVRWNRIHHNTGYGVHVHTNSKPIIEENDIYDNQSDGVSCWGGADPRVLRNKIHGNKSDGVYIHEGGAGYYEGNEIFGQKLDGVRISKAQPRLLNNNVYENSGDGIRIISSSQAHVERNNVHENRRIGLHIYRDASAHCLFNTVTANENAGLLVYGGAQVIAEGNHILRNAAAGVYVADHAAVDLRSNEISNNGGPGIEFVSSARLIALDGNTICSNTGAGVVYYADTCPTSAATTNSIVGNGGGPAQLKDGNWRDTGSAMIMHNDAPVSFLPARAIQEGVCTFMYTREYYHAQHWFECRTCSARRLILGLGEVSVCESCVKACHVGHELSIRKYGHFYCDCGQNSSCQCMPSPSATHEA